MAEVNAPSLKPGFRDLYLRVSEGPTDKTGYISKAQAESAKSSGFGNIHRVGALAEKYDTSSETNVAKKFLKQIANFFIMVANVVRLTKLTNRVKVIDRKDFMAYTKDIEAKQKAVEKAAQQFKAAGERAENRRKAVEGKVKEAAEKFKAGGQRRAARKATEARRETVKNVLFGSAAVLTGVGVSIAAYTASLENSPSLTLDQMLPKSGTRTDAMPSSTLTNIEMPNEKTAVGFPKEMPKPDIEFLLGGKRNAVIEAAMKSTPSLGSTALATVGNSTPSTKVESPVLSTVGKIFTLDVTPFSNSTAVAVR